MGNLRIATYNVNGIGSRLPVLLRWLAETSPDIVCIQELKAPQENFPLSEISQAGYHAVWHGQKSWNGVAILSKNTVPEELRRILPGDPGDVQSRYIEANIDGITVCCIYMPNGNPAPGAKYDYKMNWFRRLTLHTSALVNSGKPVIITGDFNVMPAEIDVYRPEAFIKDALFRPEVREAFKNITDQGWTDALRKLHPADLIYTFWDYFRNHYERNAGLRIDHFLLNPVLTQRLTAAGVDRHVRGWEKSSDHAPVWIEIAR